MDHEDFTRWCEAGEWHSASPVPLPGGQISTVIRLTSRDGATAVAKRVAQPPAGLFAAEAASLRQLAATGVVSVPEVLAVGADFLVLSDHGPSRLDRIDWVSLGRQIGALHQHTSPTFGAETDNYLGLLPQINTPTPDGYAFFAEHRLLRYLREPLVDAALDRRDRAGIETIAARLPELIPAQAPALLHGDLWHANIIGTPTSAVLIDPACHYGWPEAELSMLWGCGHIPPAFFDAYTEIRPLHGGWLERFPLLHLREHLSMLAHLGQASDALARLRATLRHYR